MELEHLNDGNYIGGLTMPKKKSNYWKMDEIKKFYFEVNRKFNPDYVELIYKVK